MGSVLFIRVRQNLNLTANWTCRGVPLPVTELPFTVVVMRPKLALEKLPFGLPNCARLKTLKASRRKTAAKRSVMRKSLLRAASLCQNPGPRIRLRPELPQVPFAGATKASALIQLLTDWLGGTSEMPLT